MPSENRQSIGSMTSAGIYLSTFGESAQPFTPSTQAESDFGPIDCFEIFFCPAPMSGNTYHTVLGGRAVPSSTAPVTLQIRADGRTQIQMQPGSGASSTSTTINTGWDWGNGTGADANQWFHFFVTRLPSTFWSCNIGRVGVDVNNVETGVSDTYTAFYPYGSGGSGFYKGGLLIQSSMPDWNGLRFNHLTNTYLTLGQNANFLEGDYRDGTEYTGLIAEFRCWDHPPSKNTSVDPNFDLRVLRSQFVSFGPQYPFNHLIHCWRLNENAAAAADFDDAGYKGARFQGDLFFPAFPSSPIPGQGPGGEDRLFEALAASGAFASAYPFLTLSYEPSAASTSGASLGISKEFALSATAASTSTATASLSREFDLEAIAGGASFIPGFSAQINLDISLAADALSAISGATAQRLNISPALAANADAATSGATVPLEPDRSLVSNAGNDTVSAVAVAELQAINQVKVFELIGTNGSSSAATASISPEKSLAAQAASVTTATATLSVSPAFSVALVGSTSSVLTVLLDKDETKLFFFPGDLNNVSSATGELDAERFLAVDSNTTGSTSGASVSLRVEAAFVVTGDSVSSVSALEFSLSPSRVFVAAAASLSGATVSLGTVTDFGAVSAGSQSGVTEADFILQVERGFSVDTSGVSVSGALSGLEAGQSKEFTATAATVSAAPNVNIGTTIQFSATATTATGATVSQLDRAFSFSVQDVDVVSSAIEFEIERSQLRLYEFIDPNQTVSSATATMSRLVKLEPRLLDVAGILYVDHVNSLSPTNYWRFGESTSNIPDEAQGGLPTGAKEGAYATGQLALIANASNDSVRFDRFGRALAANQTTFAPISPGLPWSFNIWVKVTEQSLSGRSLIFRSGSLSINVLNDLTLSFTRDHTSGSSNITGPYIGLNSTKMISATWSPESGMALYVDGVQVSSDGTSTQDQVIGATTTTILPFFGHTIVADEASFWFNYELTPDDVASAYAVGIGLEISAPGSTSTALASLRVSPAFSAVANSVSSILAFDFETNQTRLFTANTFSAPGSGATASTNREASLVVDASNNTTSGASVALSISPSFSASAASNTGASADVQKGQDRNFIASGASSSSASASVSVTRTVTPTVLLSISAATVQPGPQELELSAAGVSGAL